MSGRAYDPRLLFMWPNAKISVMGGEQAADVLSTIKTEQVKGGGKAMTKEEIEAIRKPILQKYEEEGSAYYSTSRLWDDGIIDPADTRRVLALAISISLNREFEPPRSGVYRM
jgi:acetyl-CoA carboxylase carboxyltransferase component